MVRDRVVWRSTLRRSFRSASPLCACHRQAWESIVLPARFDANWSVGGGDGGSWVLATTQSRAKRTFKKYLGKTIAYKESSITSACYLCNTRRKRRGVGRFRAVPLLRVQTLSVIVILRRRGASRGRPVLGGSIKSLAFMRECPKARSD